MRALLGRDPMPFFTLINALPNKILFVYFLGNFLILPLLSELKVCGQLEIGSLLLNNENCPPKVYNKVWEHKIFFICIRFKVCFLVFYFLPNVYIKKNKVKSATFPSVLDLLFYVCFKGSLQK